MMIKVILKSISLWQNWVSKQSKILKQLKH